MTSKTTIFATVLALVRLIADLQTGVAQSRDLSGNIVISLDGAPWMGDKDAKVTMVEFSDYQCPRSGEYFNWTMRNIVKDYIETGQVKYAYRDFPINSIHLLAVKAAEGAYCAGEQGKYWEIHDRFFRNQMSIEIA